MFTFQKKDLDPQRNRNRGYKSYFIRWKERILNQENKEASQW